MKRLLYSLLFCSVCLPAPAFGWGREGHEIVARLAIHLVSPKYREKAERLLGGMTPAQAGNWMDEVADDPRYDYMKSWHYALLPLSDTDFSPEPIPGELLYEISGASGVLVPVPPRTDSQRRAGIRILLHLVADLHQPLHTGYVADSAGREVRVVFRGRTTDLHTLWGEGLIRDQHITYEECLRLSYTYSDLKKDLLCYGGYTQWLEESRALLPLVYSCSEGEIDAAYLRQCRPVVVRQLLHAAIRIADMLESSLRFAMIPDGGG